jgi:hypothetical protein
VCCQYNKNNLTYLLFGKNKFKKVQQTNVRTLFAIKNDDGNKYWFLQQDGAHARKTNNSMIAWRTVVGNGIISLSLSSTRSPDLKAFKNYLWECLKENACKSISTNSSKLQRVSGVQYWQFLYKNLKRYLINCSPGVMFIGIEGSEFQRLL